MPPKKPKGKGKGKKGPTLIDGVDCSSMTREQLEAFALRLKAEMEREREERNFFQLERDKIRTFWEITRDHLEEARTDLRQKDNEVEMAQDMADVDTKHIMQQMKYLQFENKTKIGEIRAEAMTQLKLAQEDHYLQELELLKDKRELRRLLQEREELCDMQVQELKMKHQTNLYEARLQFEESLKDMSRLHEEKVQALRQDLVLMYDMQMFEVEERKNAQIQRLITDHEKAFNEIKLYYNDITQNNLNLISSLKDQLDAQRKQAERSERTTQETLQANRRLKEPLEQAQQELVELRRKLEHSERDRAQLTRLKTQNVRYAKQAKSLTLETDALLLRNDTLAKERDELKDKFNAIITELQQKSNLQQVLLERKIALMMQENEMHAKQEELLKETIANYGKPITELQKRLQKHLTTALEEKNKTIEDLRFELVNVKKSHENLLEKYETALKRQGLSKSQGDLRV